MKKVVIFFIMFSIFFTFVPTTFAENSKPYKIRIVVNGLSGEALNLNGVNTLLKCGTSIIWGVGERMQGYGVDTFDIVNKGSYIEFSTAASKEMSYTLSSDEGEYAYFISDTVQSKDIVKENTMTKTYNLKDLKMIKLNTNFMTRKSGNYEFTIYNPLTINYEADNHGSTAEMKSDGTKDLYISEGKFNFIFKYLDQGVCAITSLENVNTKSVNNIQKTKNNVNLSKCSYTIPDVLKQYEYYIMHLNMPNPNFRAYLRGLFDNGKLDFYIDKKLKSSNQQLVLSKNPNDEYESSIWIFNQKQTSMSMSLGTSYSPGEVRVFQTRDGKRSIEIFFDDENSNKVHFIDYPAKADMVIEIYNKTTGALLYESIVSKYWDYLNSDLKSGNYIAKIYPVDKSEAINSCTYYNLKIGEKYEFTKLFSLKLK